jgi:hypothetical protein
MKYLEMFVELADRAQQLPEQQSACCSLGGMYNSLVCLFCMVDVTLDLSGIFIELFT